MEHLSARRRAIGALAAVIVMGSFVTAQHAPEGPVNVLFIMSDQHNAHTLGSYGNGFGGVQQPLTPNLDQLASEGVRFTNAFCSTGQCCPSRFTVLTGQWPHNHGNRWNDIWEPLTGIATFPSLARDAGYVTGSFGKHHMYWLEQSTPLLEDHGFDEIVDLDDYRDFCLANGQPIWTSPGNHWTMPHMPMLMTATGYTFNTNEFHPAGYVTDQVVQFLEERAPDGGDGQPFICWYQLEGPHPPLLPSGPADIHDWAHLYHPFETLDLPPNFDKVATTARLASLQAVFSAQTDIEWREFLSYYYGLITQIDWNIGRVLQKLDELGLSQNTVVVYTADHGEMAAEMHCWSKGAGSYDATGRIPLIVRFPEIFPAGQVVDALASNVDFFPTFVELTGIPITDQRRAQLDGESLVDLMVDGDEPIGWRQEIFSEFGHSEDNRHRMVRTISSKYSYDEKNGGEEEFYDLASDPWEIENRIDDPDMIVQEEIEDLRGRLAAWWNDEVGHAPLYLATGPPDSSPARASFPEPRDQMLDVARDVDPSWRPCPASATQAVFFGLDPNDLLLHTTLIAMEDTFNPGTLAPGTTYYWRVAGINGNGTGTGVTWCFTTELGGVGGPMLASFPGPEHRAENVPLLLRLAWIPGEDAETQTLHFGPEGAVVEIGTFANSVTTYDPPQLSAGTTYHWRVDQTNVEGSTEGDLWIFTTTFEGLSGRAEIVSPAHLDHAVSSYQDGLAWTAGDGAELHDVYFGTDFPLPFVAQQSAEAYDPGPLQPDTVYYWRIDEVNAFGTRLGGTWRFKTAPADYCEVGTLSCFGVGCPCGNDDPAAGCTNSSGVGASIVACGSASVTSDDLVLIVSDLPPNQFGIFFMGGGTTQVPYGDGIRCVAQGTATICRFDVRNGGEEGLFVEGPGLVAFTQNLEVACHIDVGDTWYFQAWYRDALGPCGGFFNFSNAVSVTFGP